jgi:hypothetical protein
MRETGAADCCAGVVEGYGSRGDVFGTGTSRIPPLSSYVHDFATWTVDRRLMFGYAPIYIFVALILRGACWLLWHSDCFITCS